jgi:type VI secretion system protein ImpC
MAKAKSSASEAQTVEQTAERSLLDDIVEQGRMGADVETRERGKNLVKEFISQILSGEMTVSKDTETMINARIAQIDHLISLQLNEVMHAPEFQKLEGSWRGLKFLLNNPRPARN